MTATAWAPTVDACDAYLGERTGSYEYRAIRYRHAIKAMRAVGLTNDMTIVDVGAGWTEFDYCLRTEFDWRGRYIPVDGGIDGTDIGLWTPPREADWFVALEILEHVHNWKTVAFRMQQWARKGVVFSTPNPETTDVLGMDSTHVVEVHKAEAEGSLDFTVTEETFYGGVFSNGRPDSLFGIWEA